MEATDLVPLLEALDDDIDGLEGALAPLTKTALTDAASRLPLLDQAQLYVLVTYAIETILFCQSFPNCINVLAESYQHIYDSMALMPKSTQFSKN